MIVVIFFCPYVAPLLSEGYREIFPPMIF